MSKRVFLLAVVALLATAMLIAPGTASALVGMGETPTPTFTPEPPTDTPVPPTDTPIPPTDTPVPPTDTPVPPTDTPVPEAPTDTPVPPQPAPPATDTPAPTPTDTPVPTATPEQAMPVTGGNSSLDMIPAALLAAGLLLAAGGITLLWRLLGEGRGTS